MDEATIIKACGSNWNGARLEQLPQDASNRTFIRVIKNGKTLIFINSSSEKEKIPKYITISNLLRANKLMAPAIYNVDFEKGYIVVEDLGRETIGQNLIQGKLHKEDLYQSILELLVAFRNISEGSIDFYSVEKLMDEVMIFSNYYLPSRVNIPKSEKQKFLEIWQNILNELAKPNFEKCFVHKDFHLDNLILVSNPIGNNNLGIIDFQDAKFGSIAYDLASLLNDPRYPLNSEQRGFLYTMFVKNISNKTSFQNAYCILVVQRSVKILGNIAYLAMNGKAKYLSFEANLVSNILREIEHPCLNDFKNWINDNLDWLKTRNNQHFIQVDH